MYDVIVITEHSITDGVDDEVDEVLSLGTVVADNVDDGEEENEKQTVVE